VDICSRLHLRSRLSKFLAARIATHKSDLQFSVGYISACYFAIFILVGVTSRCYSSEK